MSTIPKSGETGDFIVNLAHEIASAFGLGGVAILMFAPKRPIGNSKRSLGTVVFDGEPNEDDYRLVRDALRLLAGSMDKQIAEFKSDINEDNDNG